MRSRQLVAFVMATLSCAICMASCVQEDPSTESLATEESAIPVTDTPPLESAGAGDAQLLILCLALAPASVPVKEEFCRSLPDPGMRAGCWKYRFSKLEWIGWCYATFSD